MRSLWDLTRHFTARADDNHAAPCSPSEEGGVSTPVVLHLNPGKVPRVSSN
nr:hypothetical protein [uncultured bacterium]